MSTTRSAVDPVQDEVLVKTVVLPVSREHAFVLFCDPGQLESWLCSRARVDAQLGGRYELFWDPQDPENDSTIGCRITAFKASELLAFQWRSPRQFKMFANCADPLTHVVVAFHESSGSTTVTLVHSGWRSSPDWLQAAHWQSTAWDYAFEALVALAGGAK